MVRSMIGTFRKLYGSNYTKHVVQLKDLSNRVVRHEGYTMKTYAEFFNESCKVGFTRASCTKVQYARIYDPKWKPYTKDGRALWREANQKLRKLHLDDIWTNDDMLGIYARNNNYRHNFEYYMNRPYAIKRDKVKCVCCKNLFTLTTWRYIIASRTFQLTR
ncbi:hypothetical protein [Paenibacillus sp. sgz302251]|uniref:hypothetical protein n=1 Tax=Paenibacillus sp. sgz302251 TaxID=3414493 RepID=UPI003C7991BC